MMSLSDHQNTDNSSSKLLAWCSRDSNIIEVVEFDKEKEVYASFEGAQTLNTGTTRH